MIVHSCPVVKQDYKTCILFIKLHRGLKMNKQCNKDVEMLLETDKAIIGKKFREYSKSKHLTQFELAEKVGLNEKQISRIEAGLNYPTYLTFVKLTNNPLQDEVIHLIKNASEAELKMYIDVLKSLKKNFKNFQSK